MKLLRHLILLAILSSLVNLLRLTDYNPKADTLSENEKLDSNSKKYFAILQTDGNFVVYSAGATNGRGKDYPIWASNTENKGNVPRKLTIQKDGNLVIYDSSNSPQWASNTNGKGAQPYNLIMQDDGNLVLYSKDNQPIWASNTMGKQ